MSSDWFTESLKEYKAIFVVHVSKSKISYVLTQVTCTEQEAKISGKNFTISEALIYHINI